MTPEQEQLLISAFSQQQQGLDRLSGMSSLLMPVLHEWIS
jgi:hypothetical protein